MWHGDFCLVLATEFFPLRSHATVNYRGTSPFWEHKLWSRINVHVVFVSVSSVEGKQPLKGLSPWSQGRTVNGVSTVLWKFEMIAEACGEVGSTYQAYCQKGLSTCVSQPHWLQSGALPNMHSRKETRFKRFRCIRWHVTSLSCSASWEVRDPSAVDPCHGTVDAWHRFCYRCHEAQTETNHIVLQADTGCDVQQLNEVLKLLGRTPGNRREIYSMFSRGKTVTINFFAFK